MNYKELQEWGRRRRRTIIVHQRVEPGEVLLFSDRKRYRVMPNGSRVRILPDAPSVADAAMAGGPTDPTSPQL